MGLNKRYIGIIGLVVISALAIAGYKNKYETIQQEENDETYIEDDYEKFLQEKVLPNMIKNNTHTIESCDIDQGDIDLRKEELDLSEGDIVLQDEDFVDKINEININFDKYIGRNVSYEGFVYKGNEGQDEIHIVGRYLEETHENHSHETLMGLQGIYDGQWPAEDTWVQVKGIIEKSQGGYQEVPVIKIEEIIVKPEGGQRKVYN